MATVSSTTTNTTAGTNSTAASKSVNEQTDKFLKILLTELQNQNPLSPVDTAQYTSQLAAYSSLEQQIKTNDKLDKLLGASSASAISPVSYLGTAVDYNSPTAPVQNKKTSWTYSTAGASEVLITVKDAQGAVVYTGAGDAKAGNHTLTLTAGAAVPDGTPLTISITARDSTGAAIKPVITARARIDAVDTSSGTVKLEASGYQFEASKVTRITQPNTTTTAVSS